MGTLLQFECGKCDHSLNFLEGVGMIGIENRNYYCKKCGKTAQTSQDTRHRGIFGPSPEPDKPVCEEHGKMKAVGRTSRIPCSQCKGKLKQTGVGHWD